MDIRVLVKNSNRFKFNASIFILIFVFFASLEAETFSLKDMKTVKIHLIDISSKTYIGLMDVIHINL